jgi:hypothetical protein
MRRDPRPFSGFDDTLYSVEHDHQFTLNQMKVFLEFQVHMLGWPRCPGADTNAL